MSKGWGRYFAVGVTIVLCFTIAFLWLSLDLERQSRAERERQMYSYWDALVTAHYDLYGDWSGLRQFLINRENVPGFQAESDEFKLWLWDQEGSPVYGSEGKEFSRESIPVLHDSQVVGYIDVEMKDVNRFSTASIVYAAILMVAGVCLLAVFMRSVQRKSLVDLQKVADKISAINRKPINQRGYNLSRQMMKGLNEIEDRLGTLERVRKTMVADVAHELRTPLSTIRTLTENALASGQALHTGQIGILHEETYRMSKLINDLNQLALAESGHLRLEKMWFSLAELLQQTMEAMMPEAEDRDLRLEWKNESASPLLFGDRVRLQQVMVNLLGNALKHARNRVDVRIFDSDSMLCFSVSDDGAGIEQEEIPYIFDRFYRSNREKGGLGLGLAIVKEFVAAHGGDISVRSGWNEGACFTVCLPSIKD